MSRKALDEITDKVLAFDPTKPAQTGPLKVIAGALDRPLIIGDIEIPCFVLEGETRVLSGRGMTKAIGMRGRGQGVMRIISHRAIKPFIDNELSMAITHPLKFTGVGSRVTAGYEATILLKICEAIFLKNPRLVGLRRSLVSPANSIVLTGCSGLTGFFVVKNACRFGIGKGTIRCRKFRNDKNPVNLV